MILSLVAICFLIIAGIITIIGTICAFYSKELFGITHDGLLNVAIGFLGVSVAILILARVIEKLGKSPKSRKIVKK
jgi:FtsH-binding integral membrane protein